MQGFFDPDSCDMSDELRVGLQTIYGDGIDFRAVNLEDTLAYLDMTAHARAYADPQTVQDTEYVGPLRAAVTEYVRRRLDIQPPDDQTPGFPARATYIRPQDTDACHRVLMGRHLNPGTDRGAFSTVITTNYDLVADWTLHALETGPWDRRWSTRLQKLRYLRGRATLEGTEKSATEAMARSGWYLKLHGSLDWFHCPNPDCQVRAGCFSAVFDTQWAAGADALPAHYHPNLPCLCGAHYQSLIVPPTMSKDYRAYPTIESEWRIAVTQLQKADRVIVVGLSFAPSDTRLMWLMRYGLRGFGCRPIDLVYLAGRDDGRDVAQHALVRRVRELVPQADISACPEGLLGYVESEGLLDHHTTRQSGQ